MQLVCLAYCREMHDGIDHHEGAGKRKEGLEAAQKLVQALDLALYFQPFFLRILFKCAGREVAPQLLEIIDAARDHFEIRERPAEPARADKREFELAGDRLQRLGGRLRAHEKVFTGSGKLTYHSSCHLTRILGVREEPLLLISALQGAEFVPMPDAMRCCGFGGVMRIRRWELSNSIGDAKAADIISTGASAVVTGCPGCRMQIIDALRRAGSGAPVLHTVQVLEKALPRDMRCAMQAAEKQESCIFDHAS
ncbi:MAG: Fe-S oxidoreductase [Parcubacteria group bacterium GW2011_GWB1_56_8]|nr:MAG: Fe-S oxidoreductase [Parcubacteria group bacterium GW2011_GWB1_56_8]